MTLGAVQFDRAIRCTVVPPLAVGGGVNPPVIMNPEPPIGGFVNRSPLHLRFTVSKSITPEPNRCVVTAWGLQKTTRDSIAGASRRVVDWIPGGVSTPLIKVDGRLLPSDPVVVDTTAGMAHLLLEAGYGPGLSQIFAGTCSKVRLQRVGGREWLTTMHCGESELQLTQAQANQSFDPGTPAIAVLQYFAQVCGLTIAPTAALSQVGGYILQHGLVAQGRARQGIADMLDTLQLRWWVEDGQLWILGDGEVVAGPPVLTSPEDLPGMHRLLEAPMRLDDNGVRCKMQLAPDVRPGHALIIASSELAGNYRIEQLVHSGDNRSGPFETVAIVRTQSPLGL